MAYAGISDLLRSDRSGCAWIYSRLAHERKKCNVPPGHRHNRNCWLGHARDCRGVLYGSLFSDNGSLNQILGWFGVSPISWLFSFPMVSVIIANIWHGTAFSMMVYQSALDDIPKEVEEAAIIDGSTGFQIIRHITIPMVKGSIVTNMMLVTLQTLGVFTLIYTMTGGGLGTSTQTLPIFMYNQAFVNYQFGYGTAISLVLLFIGIIASLFYIRSMKVKV